MTEFVERIAISAPPARVWQVMADLEAWPQWTPSVERVTTIEWATTGVGSRFLVMQPRLKPAEFTTTEWTPGSGFTWASAAPGVHATASHRIEPRGEGSEVELRLRFSGPLAWPVALLQRALVRHYMRQEAQGLKARAEQ
jgi:uncharacterized membrane protein